MLNHLLTLKRFTLKISNKNSHIKVGYKTTKQSSISFNTQHAVVGNKNEAI